jgi:hypothetical protein
LTSSISGQTTGRIGINVVEPTAEFTYRCINNIVYEATLVQQQQPNDGDIWFEENTITGLKIRVSSVTRTLTMS